jgi:hypothetical protein
MPMNNTEKIARRVQLPLPDDLLEMLHIGDELLLTGEMYV